MRMTIRPSIAVAFAAAALVATACSGQDTSPTSTTQAPPTTTTIQPQDVTTTTVPPSTTTAPTTTTTTTAPPTTAAPIGYEHTIPVGADGISYNPGGEDLEGVGPSIFAAAGGKVYVNDPVDHRLWILSDANPVTIDLVDLDILNVTAMTATNDRVVLVEVLFAPERQRIHELTGDGQLLRTVDIPQGARLEDGLSGILVDDDSEFVVVLAGGASFATVDESGLSVNSSISLGGSTVEQAGPDYLINGTLVTADLAGPLGGLRILGSGGGSIVLVREDVLNTSPMEILASVEWYLDAEFAGSALMSLDGQAIPVAPGIAVTDDGRVLVLRAGADTVSITELAPQDERVIAPVS